MLSSNTDNNTPPAELINLLQKNKTARAFYDALSPSCKREYNQWVGSAKKETTRMNRAEKAIELLNNQQQSFFK